MGMHIRSGDGPAYTQELAAFLATFSYDDLPPVVTQAARRGILDWLGCAFAAHRHPTLDKLLMALSDNGSSNGASVLARQIRLSHTDAALVNGQMGHLLDYDDTHMAGVILHASSPVLAALFSAADMRQVSGRDFIAAYVAGFEAGVRIGQSAPDHHPGGWHLTGTLGTFAAAAAVGKLFGLDAQKMTHALGIAGTQAAGMQQNRGTMCKSFHAGRAASNGLLAALLAEKGFDSSEEIVEGKRGFARIYSKQQALERLTQGLGKEWLIATNGHKPYACGVVLHPAIDAMVALRAQMGHLLGDAASESASGAAGAGHPGAGHPGGGLAGAGAPAAGAPVDSVEIQVNPQVVTITGTVAPTTGLHSKFSIYHSAAVAMIDGAAGIAQYSDERAADPRVAALRDKITVSVDDTLRRDQATARIVIGGQVFETKVEHATGTADNPMSDAAIEKKFLANAVGAVDGVKAADIVASAWRFDELEDVRDFIAKVN
jgi:2-methylcitrate dehydratase PrpD